MKEQTMKIFLALWYAMKALARLAMIGMAMAVLGSGSAHAATGSTAGKVQVEVVGMGRPLLMIPGLNSSAEAWRETCLALKDVQCHLVQLPGFAGAAAADPRPAGFLPAMRGQLLAYLHDQHLGPVVVIGHSLGGVLGLQMAQAEPKAISALVVVDALPFLPAARDPSATADSVRPMADQLRKGMLAADAVQWQAQLKAGLPGMTRDPRRQAELGRWGEASDRQTTADAMHAVMTTDLRDSIASITAPTLVLGSWAGYQPMGGTEDGTRAVFQAQYANLQGVQIAMSAQGFHFLMWDDPRWLRGTGAAIPRRASLTLSASAMDMPDSSSTYLLDAQCAGMGALWRCRNRPAPAYFSDAGSAGVDHAGPGVGPVRVQRCIRALALRADWWERGTARLLLRLAPSVAWRGSVAAAGERRAALGAGAGTG
jgi:pimeloyl-ACP methyl ester carboxylesterase